MTTLHDVAVLAGVSPATASHALSGARPVSETLRARVLKAANDLGYEPDHVARSLRTRRSLAVGVVVSDISQPAHTSAIRAIEAAARNRGYTVVLCDSGEDLDAEAAGITLLRSRRVDGLVIVPAGQPHDQLMRIVAAGTPLIFLDRTIDELPVSCATLDNEHAAWSAVTHLIAHGHRRIGLVHTKPGISTSRDRSAGYARALAEHAIDFDERLIVWGGVVGEEGAVAMSALMSLEAPPTAVFVGGNHVTIGALRFLARAGVPIPHGLAVVGHADSDWCEVVRPALTTVSRPWYQLGQTAASMLFEQIDSGGPHAVKRVLLRCDLTIRDSCGPHSPGAFGPALSTERISAGGVWT